MNEIELQKLASLETAIKAATKAAGKLLRCAESISNPQYVVTMEGQQLEVLAAAHTAGVITLRVKSPLSDIDQGRRRALEQARNETQDPAITWANRDV